MTSSVVIVIAVLRYQCIRPDMFLIACSMETYCIRSERFPLSNQAGSHSMVSQVSPICSPRSWRHG
jgi:hypothetical protein